MPNQNLSKRAVTQAATKELIADLIAFRSILYKLGFDESADEEKIFVEMANEAGFRTTTGAPLTYMGYRQMFKRADQDEIREVVKSVSRDRIVFSFT